MKKNTIMAYILTPVLLLAGIIGVCCLCASPLDAYEKTIVKCVNAVSSGDYDAADRYLEQDETWLSDSSDSSQNEVRQDSPRMVAQVLDAYGSVIGEAQNVQEDSQFVSVKVVSVSEIQDTSSDDFSNLFGTDAKAHAYLVAQQLSYKNGEDEAVTEVVYSIITATQVGGQIYLTPGC